MLGPTTVSAFAEMNTQRGGMLDEILALG